FAERTRVSQAPVRTYLVPAPAPRASQLSVAIASPRRGAAPPTTAAPARSSLPYVPRQHNQQHRRERQRNPEQHQRAAPDHGASRPPVQGPPHPAPLMPGRLQASTPPQPPGSRTVDILAHLAGPDDRQALPGHSAILSC